MNLSHFGEKNLISHLRQSLAQAARDALVLDIGDDTAAFRVSGSDKLTLFTCDMMVEDQHFRRGWHPPYQLGWKALASNVSDIAAMGGRPTFALVSIALPGQIDVEYVDQIYSGLTACAKEYGVILAGGDTVGSPGGIVIDVSLLGEVEPDKLLRRSGAHPGDLIAVTGTLGAAAAGLQLLESGKGDSAAALANALLEPKPRLAESKSLAATGLVTAMMDLSDGLAEDLPRLCQESKTGAVVTVEDLPLPAESQRLGLDALRLAVSGGEDYQLLFTFAPESKDVISAALETANCAPPRVIGKMTAPEAGVRFTHTDGSPYAMPQGFQHFSRDQESGISEKRV